MIDKPVHNNRKNERLGECKTGRPRTELSYPEIARTRVGEGDAMPSNSKA